MATFSLPLPSALTLIFLCAILVALAVSIFLIYHWYTYGENRAVSTVTTFIYLAGVGAALLAMGSAIVAL